MHPDAEKFLARASFFLLAAMLVAPGSMSVWGANAPAQKAFPTADAAWKAFVAAVEQKDTSAVKAILGPELW